MAQDDRRQTGIVDALELEVAGHLVPDPRTTAGPTVLLELVQQEGGEVEQQ